jgi:hypothetical protein
MSTIKFIGFFSCLMLLSCCSFAQGNKPKDKSEKEEKVPMVGGDRDSHGCIGSAGYQWSVLKNECIRIFEAGIGLDPKVTTFPKTSGLFIVFKSAADDAKVEIFMPNGKAFLLAKQKGAAVWKDKTYMLKLNKGVYVFENVKKTLVYEGKAK